MTQFPAVIALEAIGDNWKAMRRFNPEALERRQWDRWKAYAFDPSRWPWVAEIIGLAPLGKLCRSFIRGQRDYRDCNGTGSRGIMIYFHLYPGKIYEVNELLTWDKSRRYFCRVVDGRIVELVRRRHHA